jgi:signal transduction histidine kinase
VAALVLYRRIVKRQVREAGLVMEARLRAEQELNKAKDEFIAGLSHEFRTPLTTIFGFSEVLIDSGLVDPDSSMELISLINSESAELSRMVEDLLTAARLEADALTISTTTVDPAEIVESVLGPWRRSGTEVHVDLAPAAVHADPLRLRQVLRNLVSNAVKHGGEQVTVVGRNAPGGYAWSVVDDGPGVSDEIAGRLFDRYIHDGRRALLAGSVGLGLNIARSLAEAMGGSLEYSRRDGATWFTLVSPLAASPDRTTNPVDAEVA